MAAGRMRCTRRLRSWIVEQVSSGKFPGLVWDDEAKTMFRIPWKHAGKQDFRKNEDAAIFKAWAEFKGKLTVNDQNNPASWKTRLRCALNKSPEFMEVPDRAQLDISEPYKVYRLVPLSEQGLLPPETKSRERRSKRRRSSRRSRRRRSQSESEEEEEPEEEEEEDDVTANKRIKKEEEEEVTSQQRINNILLQNINEPVLHNNPVIQREPSAAEATETASAITVTLDEIRLDVRIEENLPVAHNVQDSFSVVVQYLGQEVLKRLVQGTDVRIKYLPSSPIPPTAAVLKDRFPRIHLPEPPASLPAGQELQGLRTLLPFMDKGVLLTSTHTGVYARRYCRGRVFWTGPHADAGSDRLQKMERNAEPVLLFSRDAFKQQLAQYGASGGEPPQCGVTLCFGEELGSDDDTSRKLIIVQITFPWAEQQVLGAASIFESISLFQSLAAQSEQGEIILDLVAI